MALTLAAGVTGCTDDASGSSEEIGDTSSESGETGSTSSEGETGGSEGGSEGGSGGGDAGLSAGDLLITEIMTNPPDIGDDEADLQWVELHNPTAEAIELMGLGFSIGNTEVAIDDSVVVPAGGYVVVGGSLDATQVVGLTPAWDWSPIAGLSQGGDTAVTISVAPGGAVIDTVLPMFPEFAFAEQGWGHSLAPDALDATANDAGANWCLAAWVVGGEPRATPGAPNNPCP